MSNKSKLKERFFPRPMAFANDGNNHSRPPQDDDKPEPVPVAEGLVAYDLPESEVWKMQAMEEKIQRIQAEARTQLEPLMLQKEELVRRWEQRLGIPRAMMAGTDTKEMRLLVRVPTGAELREQERLTERQKTLEQRGDPRSEEAEG